MIVQDLFAVWVYRKTWNRRIFVIVVCGMVVVTFCPLVTNDYQD